MTDSNTDKAREIAEKIAAEIELFDQYGNPVLVKHLADIIRKLLPPVEVAESDEEFIEAMFNDEKNAFPVVCHYGGRMAKEHWVRQLAAYRHEIERKTKDKTLEEIGGIMGQPAQELDTVTTTGLTPKRGGKDE